MIILQSTLELKDRFANYSQKEKKMSLLKKKLVGAFVVVLLSLCVISPAIAVDCASAAIKKIGVNPTWPGTGASKYFVQLDCVDDTKWAGTISFYLSEDLGDAGLATMLTAYSLGKNLWIRTAGVATGSLVTVLYMND